MEKDLGTVYDKIIPVKDEGKYTIPKKGTKKKPVSKKQKRNIRNMKKNARRKQRK